jgi:hypothetical protein
MEINTVEWYLETNKNVEKIPNLEYCKKSKLTQSRNILLRADTYEKVVKAKKECLEYLIKKDPDVTVGENLEMVYYSGKAEVRFLDDVENFFKQYISIGEPIKILENIFNNVMKIELPQTIDWYPYRDVFFKDRRYEAFRKETFTFLLCNRFNLLLPKDVQFQIIKKLSNIHQRDLMDPSRKHNLTYISKTGLVQSSVKNIAPVLFWFDKLKTKFSSFLA